MQAKSKTVDEEALAIAMVTQAAKRAAQAEKEYIEAERADLAAKE